MIQKINKKNTPELRFTEFSGEWEEGTIQELIDMRNIIGHLDGNHGELYPRSAEFAEHGIPYITANDIVNGRVNFVNCKYLPIIRAKKFKKGIAKSGDVIFAHNATVGPTGILDTEYDFVILSTTVTYYRCDLTKLSNLFLKYTFLNSGFVRQYSRVMSQSTRNQVPITTQRKFKVKVPEIGEQQKIASLLSAVDEWIENLRKQKEELEKYKKGMMQKIFSQKIRFKDDNGKDFPEWEERKLSEVGNISTGTTPPTSNSKYYNGKYPWVTPTDIDTQKNIFSSAKQLTKLGLKQGRFVSRNSLLVTCIASIGKNAILRESGSCNQQINAITPNENYNVDFLYYMVEFNRNILKRFASAGGMAILNKKDFSLLKFRLPKLKEQQKISGFLSSLDELVGSKQKQITQAENWKKGLMQRMFV